MDKKTTLILTLAKYAGYVATFWITLNNHGIGLEGPLLPLTLILSVDILRFYYLQGRFERLAVHSLCVQVVLIYAFVLIDGTTVGSILFVILIAESQISLPRPRGERVFLVAIVGFFALTLLSAVRREEFGFATLMMTMTSSLFLLFAYGVSFLARKQLEERERAERALGDLDRSRKDLEAAYRELVENTGHRERLAVTEERNRLAREIHDTLGHTLTAVIVGLEAAKRFLPVDPARALEEMQKSQEQARQGLDEVRRSVTALRPREIEDLGFGAALRGLARDFNRRGVSVELQGEHVRIPPELEVPFFRIIQEGVTNSLRHGGATRVRVRLSGQDNLYLLEVEDNGKGCPGYVEGHGLRGIRERVKHFGGRVEFKDHSPNGFEIKVEVGYGDEGDQGDYRR